MDDNCRTIAVFGFVMKKNYITQRSYSLYLTIPHWNPSLFFGHEDVFVTGIQVGSVLFSSLIDSSIGLLAKVALLVKCKGPYGAHLSRSLHRIFNGKPQLCDTVSGIVKGEPRFRLCRHRTWLTNLYDRNVGIFHMYPATRQYRCPKFQLWVTTKMS